jgi:hypothetical protein
MNTIDKWSPVTNDFLIVNAPIDRAVAAYSNWMKRLGFAFTKTISDVDLDNAFASLAPLANSQHRKLFVCAGRDWTAFFQNGIQGSDPAAHGHQLARELDAIGMRVCVTPPAYQWQAVMWEVYAPRRTGGDEFGYRRALAVANDGGKWVFINSGVPFPFERQDRYVAPRKRDRLDRQMLEAYLCECAVNPFQPGTLIVSSEAPAVLLDVEKRGVPMKEFTYAEADALHRR